MEHGLSNKALDEIIDEMIKVVQNSKDEIFQLTEESRAEYERLKQELKEIREKVALHIKEGDQLERELNRAKKQLVIVSQDFSKHSEEAIQLVYNEASELQTNLILRRQEEKMLRERRDELERRLQGLDEMIERAEVLVSKIAIVLNYLMKDFQQVNELVADAKEKQEFGLKIIEAQEEERRKISREIHDGPAQTLANIMLRSEIVDKIYRKGDQDQVLEEIQNIRKQIRASLYEVRRIIYDLRPMALDDLGLIPTIRKYIRTVSDYENIPIDFTLIGKEKRLHSDYEVASFRLMQEALQNAVKHAEATKIEVKLELRDEDIHLLVKDNGKGFDPNEKKDKSFGLIGMRERAEILEGDLKIRTKIGQGTSIFLHIPLIKKGNVDEKSQ
jgi:two-component system sensor histidine kinase DegS